MFDESLAGVRGGNIWRERGEGIFGDSGGREYLTRTRGWNIWRELARVRCGNVILLNCKKRHKPVLLKPTHLSMTIYNFFHFTNESFFVFQHWLTTLWHLLSVEKGKVETFVTVSRGPG